MIAEAVGNVDENMPPVTGAIDGTAIPAHTLQSSHCINGSVVKQNGAAEPSGFRQKFSSSPACGKLVGVRVCSCGICASQRWHRRPVAVRLTKPR